MTLPTPTITTGAQDGWTFLSASTTGLAHVRAGEVNQDRCRVVPLPGGRLFAGVADGAGSAERAAEGAELVLQAALSALGADDLTDEAALAADFQTRLHWLIEQLDAPVRDFHATIAAALLSPDGSGVLLTCGDSFILTEADDGQFLRPIPGQSGEHVGETVFPTTARPDEIRVTRVQSRFLLLSSDGLAPLLLAGEDPHPPALTPLRGWMDTVPIARVASGLHALLESAQATGRADDDLTLVLVACRP